MTLAFNVNSGVRLQPGRDAGAYVLNDTMPASLMVVNESHAQITFPDQHTDVLYGNGTLTLNVGQVTLPAIPADMTLTAFNFIDNNSIELLNASGGLTNMTVCYNLTQPGNVSVIMHSLGGGAHYGLYHFPNNTDTDRTPGLNLKLLVGAANATQTSVNVTIVDNDSSSLRCYTIAPEVSYRSFNLPDIIRVTLGLVAGAAGGLMIFKKKYAS